MSLTPLTFSGVSTYSSDFQLILNRATQIASLPITQLQNQQTDLLQQKLLVSNLSTSVAALGTSVANLGTVASQKSLQASSSNSAKVTATNVNSTAPAVYTLSEITSVAKAAAESSLTGYASATASPVSSTGTLKLIVGSNNYTIDLTGANNLTDLRNVINSLDAGVTASVLTTGTGPTPFYLSITANTTGAKTLELRDDPSGTNTNLLSALNQGADTVFKINGVPVSKSTTLINDVVPGITFNIHGTTDVSETVAVTVATDRGQISGALNNFVNNYNALSDQINAQVGKNAGLLSGDFLLREVQNTLRGLTSFPGTGTIHGLADLGIEFDSQGVASFNSAAITSLNETQLEDAFEFLGSTSTGFGGQAARLTSISDSVTGLAKIQLDKYEESDRRITDQIATLTNRIVETQKILSAKLQYADSLLASLQSQQGTIEASLAGLNLTLYGRQE